MNREDIVNKMLSVERKYIGKLQKGTESMQPVCDIWNSQNPKPRGWTAKLNSEYCAELQTVCAMESGLSDILTHECGAYEMMNGEKKAGRYFSDDKKAQSGDLIFFKFPQSYHVGIVESVTDNKIMTIEGNWDGGQCKRRIIVRSKSDAAYPYIIGFSRPDYEKYLVKRVKVKTPFWCLTTPYGPEFVKGDTVTVPCNIQPAGEGVRNFLREGEVYEVVRENGGYLALKVIGDKYTWTPWFPTAYTENA